MQNILNLDLKQLQHYFEQIGEPTFRTEQIYRGLYQKGYQSFDQFTNIPKSLRQKLAQEFVLRSFKEIERISSPLDGTTKFLWQLADGLKIESVIIYEKKNLTSIYGVQSGNYLKIRKKLLKTLFLPNTKILLYF